MKPDRVVGLLLALCAAASALDTLVLGPDERILIIAPHPDDEIVACAGLIQQALDLGDSLWVLYLTNGDGAWPSVTDVTGRLFPGPADYVTLGRARMAEARRATALLGLDSTNLTFLGYPDANLLDLWVENWDEPRKSGYTAAAANPYGTGRAYAGRNLLDDIAGAIRRIRPGRIFAPHDCDAHADHWAAAGFLAVARAAWQDSVPFPATYHYLVHRRPWPGSGPDDRGWICPPRDLVGGRHHWFALPLTGPQSESKRAALEENQSQLNAMDDYLYGFTGLNELFDVEAPADSIVTNDAPTLPLLRAARLDTLSLSRGENTVVRVRLRAKPNGLLDYRLLLHPVRRGGGAERPSSTELPPGGQVLDASLPSPSPGILLFSLEVRLGGRLVNHSALGQVVF